MNHKFWPLVGLAAFLAASLTLALLYEKPAPRTVSQAPLTGREVNNPVELTPPQTQATAAFWVEVNAVSKVHGALLENAWLQKILRKPVGQGFAGGWAPFFGSKGEDLKASFRGAVLEVVAQQLLTDPYRVVFLATEQQDGTPVVILESPGGGANSAYRALENASKRGVYTAPHCPGQETAEKIQIARWLIADHAVFAGTRDKRIVLGRQPLAVLQGLCVDLSPRDAGHDVAFVLSESGLKRATQTLANALGLKDSLRLGFKVENKSFVPTGLSGALSSARLTQAPPSPALLKVVPEETPVLLVLNAQLPEQLDEVSLRDFFAGKAKTSPRQIALAWTPRGDRNLPTEVAIVWGKPEDLPALEKIFSGPNRLARATHCGHAVLASSDHLLGRFAQACDGKIPNLTNAAPAIAQGFKEPSSIALGVHLGKLASQITEDGFWSDTPPADPKHPLTRTLPPEIEAAKRDLETLPFMGFRGTAQGSALVGGGFRS
ncbi:MAG: hypothetical protein ACT4TC_01910 [Myxococcaceae bacterium]